MKNSIKISLLSIMFTAFAVAKEIPAIPTLPITDSETTKFGLSIQEMFALRQMYEDFTNNPKKDFTLTITHDNICVRNNKENEEVCIHKAILAELLHQAYQKHGHELLEAFKNTQFSPGTIRLQGNNPHVSLDENGKFLVNPEDIFGFKLNAQAENNSANASFSSYMTTSGTVESKSNIHVPEKVDIISETEYDPNTQTFRNYMVHIRNLKTGSN